MTLRVAEAKSDGSVRLVGSGLTVDATSEQPLKAGSTVTMEVVSTDKGLVLRPEGSAAKQPTETAAQTKAATSLTSTPSTILKLSTSSSPESRPQSAGTLVTSVSSAPSSSPSLSSSAAAGDAASATAKPQPLTATLLTALGLKTAASVSPSSAAANSVNGSANPATPAPPTSPATQASASNTAPTAPPPTGQGEAKSVLTTPAQTVQHSSASTYSANGSTTPALQTKAGLAASNALSRAPSSAGGHLPSGTDQAQSLNQDSLKGSYPNSFGTKGADANDILPQSTATASATAKQQTSPPHATLSQATLSQTALSQTALSQANVAQSRALQSPASPISGQTPAPALSSNGSMSSPVTTSTPASSTPTPASATAGGPVNMAATLAAAVQESVPRQDSLGGLFAAAQMLLGTSAEADGGSPSNLPANVEAATKQILGLRVPASDIDGPRLKAAIQHSGTFSENALLTGGRDSQSSSTGAMSEALTSSMASVLSGSALSAPGDTKSALLLLRQILSTWVGPTAEGSEDVLDQAFNRPAPPRKGGAPQAQSQAQSEAKTAAQAQMLARTAAPNTAASEQLGRLLQNQTDRALARVRLSQIASLPNGGDDKTAPSSQLQPQQWTAEIPIALGRETRIIQLDIEREPGESGHPEGGDDGRPIVVRFAIDLGEAGPLHAHIHHMAGHVGVRIWAEKEDTAVHIARYKGELSAALGACGLAVDEMLFSVGAPTYGAPPAAQKTDLTA